jgi:hypothetical protein
MGDRKHFTSKIGVFHVLFGLAFFLNCVAFLFVLKALIFTYGCAEKEESAIAFNTLLENIRQTGAKRIYVLNKTDYRYFCKLTLQTDQGSILTEAIKKEDCPYIPSQGELLLSSSAPMATNRYAVNTHLPGGNGLFWWWLLSESEFEKWRRYRRYEPWTYQGGHYTGSYSSPSRSHTSSSYKPTTSKTSSFSARFQRKASGNSFWSRFQAKFGRTRIGSFRGGGFGFGK